MQLAIQNGFSFLRTIVQSVDMSGVYFPPLKLEVRILVTRKCCLKGKKKENKFYHGDEGRINI